MATKVVNRKKSYVHYEFDAQNEANKKQNPTEPM